MHSTSHRLTTALFALGALSMIGFFGVMFHTRRQETQRQHRSIDRTLVLMKNEEQRYGSNAQFDAVILKTSYPATL